MTAAAAASPDSLSHPLQTLQPSSPIPATQKAGSDVRGRSVCAHSGGDKVAVAVKRVVPPPLPSFVPYSMSPPASPGPPRKFLLSFPLEHSGSPTSELGKSVPKMMGSQERSHRPLPPLPARVPRPSPPMPTYPPPSPVTARAAMLGASRSPPPLPNEVPYRDHFP